MIYTALIVVQKAIFTLWLFTLCAWKELFMSWHSKWIENKMNEKRHTHTEWVRDKYSVPSGIIRLFHLSADEKTHTASERGRKMDEEKCLRFQSVYLVGFCLLPTTFGLSSNSLTFSVAEIEPNAKLFTFFLHFLECMAIAWNAPYSSGQDVIVTHKAGKMMRIFIYIFFPSNRKRVTKKDEKKKEKGYVNVYFIENCQSYACNTNGMKKVSNHSGSVELLSWNSYWSQFVSKIEKRLIKCWMPWFPQQIFFG